MSSTPSSSQSPINKIPFLSLIFPYACKTTLRVVELAHVNSIFEECIKNFNVAASIWASPAFLNNTNPFLYQPCDEMAEALKVDETEKYFEVMKEDDDGTTSAADTNTTTTKSAEDKLKMELEFEKMSMPSYWEKQKEQKKALAEALFSKTTKNKAFHHECKGGQSFNQVKCGMNKNLELVMLTAVNCECLWVIKQLLHAGVFLTPVTVTTMHCYTGWSPLHHAVWYGKRSMRLFIAFSIQRNPEYGYVDLDAKTYPEGSYRAMAPLHVAISQGSFKYVKELVFEGLVDISGNDKKDEQLIRNNYSMSAPLTEKLFSNFMMESYDEKNEVNEMLMIAKLLICSGEIDVNSLDKSGRTLLQTHVDQGNVGIVKLLLEAGANPDGNTSSDSTVLSPLQICARMEKQQQPTGQLTDSSNYYPMTKLLIKHGADVDMKATKNVARSSDRGQTPAHLAINVSNVGFIKILKEAKDKWGGKKNADFSIKNGSKLTVSEYAKQVECDKKCLEEIEKLVRDTSRS